MHAKQQHVGRDVLAVKIAALQARGETSMWRMPLMKTPKNGEHCQLLSVSITAINAERSSY